MGLDLDADWYAAWIAIHGKLNMSASVRSTLELMTQRGVKPNLNVFRAKITAYINVRPPELEAALDCLDEMLRMRMRPTPDIFALLIKTTMKVCNRDRE